MFKRAYKYRFYPTNNQSELLSKTFGCVRFVYNKVLRWRTDTYYESKTKIGYLQANAKLSELKKQFELQWLNDVSSVPLQQCLRHQQSAFKNFFEGRAKYPAFKKKTARQSAEYTRSAFKFQNGELFLAKSKEPLDIRWSRDLPSQPSTITVSKDPAGRYFVSFLCEFAPEKLPVSPKSVGVDVGIKSLLAFSNGGKIGNPKHTAKYATKLAKYQRRLAKKKPGSANRAKAKLKVARIHAKISDCRKDFLHKQSRKLVNDNQVICIESLKVKNMIRNTRLSKAIADASWGEFARQLAYKAEWSGRKLVAIDQWFPSSKRCSSCGYISESMPLDVREWQCPECGSRHDRDINAAKNILAAGQAVIALGENVSPVSVNAGTGDSL
ncbi:MAG: RNA-guided endonuclease InsQ/TnpB family protein [Porticoccaceae bacterium]|jgi:putative transposase